MKIMIKISVLSIFFNIFQFKKKTSFFFSALNDHIYSHPITISSQYDKSSHVFFLDASIWPRHRDRVN